MSHHLQVVGLIGDMRAKCSCGEWEKSDPRWNRCYTEGRDVWWESWPDFVDHVHQYHPEYIVCFQYSGWSQLIPYKDRNMSNLSDGTVFSTIRKAKEYGDSRRMEMFRIQAIMLPPDDPQIDFFLQSIEEKDRRLGVKAF